MEPPSNKRTKQQQATLDSFNFVSRADEKETHDTDSDEHEDIDVTEGLSASASAIGIDHLSKSKC